MSDGRILVLTFDGSFDGFLNTIYSYYYEKVKPDFICKENYQQLLNAEYLFIETDNNKAKRVYNAICTKISKESGIKLYHAFSYNSDNHYIDLFKYIIFGFKVGNSIDNHTNLDFVLTVHKYSKAVEGEAHSMLGFCRFAETAQGIYYCKITPKHDILSIISEHFADRFNNEKWVIHDVKRGLASVYDGRRWIVSDVGRFANVEFSEKESDYQKMWKSFFQSIAIEERKNTKLQKQFVKNYQKKNMNEFFE